MMTGVTKLCLPALGLLCLLKLTKVFENEVGQRMGLWFRFSAHSEPEMLLAQTLEFLGKLVTVLPQTHP